MIGAANSNQRANWQEEKKKKNFARPLDKRENIT
jgi:hypothetical protein